MSILWKTCRNPICLNNAQPGEEHCLECIERNDLWAGRAEEADEPQEGVETLREFIAHWHSGNPPRSGSEAAFQMAVPFAIIIACIAVALAIFYLSHIADKQAAERGLTPPSYTKEVRH